MTRTAPLDLDGFDPDVLDAARDVARRAGVPVETWIASIVSPESIPAAPSRAAIPESPQHVEIAVQPSAGASADEVATPAPDQLIPVESARQNSIREYSIREHSIQEDSAPREAAAETPIAVASSAPAAEAPQPAEPLTSTIAEMMRRLDAIDRRIAQDLKASQDATARSIGEIEARLSTVLDTGPAPADQVTQRFGEIERRMTELGERVAAPRALGRRGREAGVEVRDAVSEIRQRQRELDGGGTAVARPAAAEFQQVARFADELAETVHVRVAADVERLAAKLDVLRDGAPMSGGANSDAIIHRIDALSEKVDRVGVNPVGDLIDRLEDLGATLRRPVVPGEDIAAIHGMLHDLAVKFDRIGTADGPKDEGLDALEQQVLALASRIDSRAADPALAGLERTMSDLLTQVSALRAEGPMDAAVERAARNAVAESIATGSEPGELGLLRASLADMRAHQTASEQRMQATLSGVYTALEQLVGRLGTLATEEAPAAPPRRADPPAPVAQRPQRTRPAPEVMDLVDLPLEPGAGRPGRERLAEPAGTPGTTDGDIKTNFIAAARRAAQAAQAEASESVTALDTRDLRGTVRSPASAGTEVPSAGRLARLRAEIDRRRKPLLLGLATIVLVLGALQAVNTRNPAQNTVKAPAIEAPVVAETVAPAAPAPATDVAKSAAEPAPKSVEPASKSVEPAPKSVEPAPKSAPPADPVTTQSLAETAPLSATPPARAASPVPRVTAMEGLSGDLSAMPPGFAKLREAVLDGDGASVYELAARAAEGRGVPRDLALSAKLFEKLATAGYAQAQYKLASFYEKGNGVTRDLVQAKLWYTRAAEQGHARSMHNLAVIYAENPTANGKPDFATAAQWFKRAAEYGMRDSQYNLAVLNARGLGQPQDLTQSYLWFSAAAAQGDEDAAKKRDDVASKIDPKGLAAARSLAAAFKAKVPEPAVNDVPALASTGRTMTLLGVPAPVVAAPRRG